MMSNTGWTDAEWEAHIKSRKAYEDALAASDARNQEFCRKQDRLRLIEHAVFSLFGLLVVWIAWWGLKLCAPIIVESVIGFPAAVRQIVHSVFSLFY